MRTLVHGFAIAGEATVRALLKFGHHVVVTDAGHEILTGFTKDLVETAG